MKNKFLLLVVFLSCSNLFAEWKVVDSLYYPYKDGKLTTMHKVIDCYDSKNCIAFLWVGDQSIQTRSTSDGGISWNTFLIDTIIREYDEEQGDYDAVYRPQRPQNIHYQSKNLCIALCDSGYYWRSTDSCQTWKKYKIDTDMSLLHIDFINDNIGVICNYYNAYLTDDGGLTWNLIDNITEIQNGARYQDVKLTSEQEIIFLVYKTGKDNYLLRTTDAGESWEYFDKMSTRVSKIYFFNINEGFAAGRNQIEPGSSRYRDIIQETSDGGKTWEVRVDSFDTPYKGLLKIEFADRMHGIAMGSFWRLWKTSDGGKTWQWDTTVNYDNIPNYFWDIAYPSPDTVYGVTAMTGKIYMKTDYTVGVEQKPDETYTTVSLYPNPARPGETITISIDSEKPESCTASVYSADGRQVSNSFNFDLRPGQNGIQYTADTDLSPGVYFVIIEKGCGVISARFVVGE